MNAVSPTKEVKIPLASLVGAATRPKIKLQSISKSFGKTQANKEISFDIEVGSIHSIVGQNGAGKSTLMKILFGLETPDSGEIFLDDELLTIDSPRAALSLGIGLLQQEFSLIDDLTGIENLILGNEPVGKFFIDYEAALARAKELQTKLNLQIPWEEKISTFSMAQKQQVEILRLLAYGANVLILDEPTAVLAPLQIQALMDLLFLLKKEGKTIIYISHKLQEVMQISDRITVLREGIEVSTLPISEANLERIANMIVGETFHKAASSFGFPGDAVLSIRNLSYRNAKNFEKVRNVSVEIPSRSITGICGVAGNGQEEFVHLLAGLARPTTGSIILTGQELANTSVRNKRRQGIAYISPDRKSEGLAMSGSLVENAVGGFQFLLARYSWLRKKDLLEHSKKILERFDVAHGDLSNSVATLSGGNQQKLMVGREITHNPKVLLASQPSRGVDLGGVNRIHEFLRDVRDSGTAIVLASEDLDELIEMSDRILVFFNGEISGTYTHPFDRQQIGRSMLGMKNDA